MHDLVTACYMILTTQPMEEARAIRQQRISVVSTLRTNRNKLVCDPAATEEDVAALDHLIEMAERKLGWLPAAEEELKEQRRREKTRERVRRYRDRKRVEAASRS